MLSPIFKDAKIKAFYRKTTMHYLTCFAHILQYFSITTTPSPTSNNASVVAMLAQIIHNLFLRLWESLAVV